MDKEKPKLTDEEKLKQLIYLGDINGKYICGGPDLNRLQNKLIDELLKEFIKNSHENLLKFIEIASKDKLLPSRLQLFQILAYTLTLDETTPSIKSKISSTALKLAKLDEEMVAFVKYTTTLRKNKTTKTKLPSTVRKTVEKYYEKKSAEDLSKSYVSSKSNHGWTHKDLLKYCHVKSDTPLKNAIVNYVMFQKLKETDVEAEAKQLIDLMEKADTLRRTQDKNTAVALISELKATINQVEPSLKKSAEVWNAALPNMSYSDLLHVLPRLYRRGFLKKDTPTHAQINEILTNAQKVKASGIHPLEIFIHMKNFEKGGKFPDPKLLQHLKTEKKLTDEEAIRLVLPAEVKAPVIMSNIQKCMNISLHNVQSVGKRFLLTIDTTNKMEIPCMRNKNITGIEAAAVIAWYLLKVEKDVTVAVFKDKEIAVVQLDKKGNLYEHIQKLKENKSEFLLLSSPIEWASAQKQHIDVFVNFVHHNEYYATIPKEHREKISSVIDALQKYRKKVNLPNAKLVNFCMSSPHLIVSSGFPNILNIAGFDAGIPKVFEAFCRGNFS